MSRFRSYPDRPNCTSNSSLLVGVPRSSTFSFRGSQSNTLVERVYQIDKAAGFDTFRSISPEAKTFTAERLAAGASLLRDLWWSAWKNSAVPMRRGSAD